MRAALTALARTPAATPEQPAPGEAVNSDGFSRSPARTLWAMLITRSYETFPLACPQCGTQMKLMSFVTETASVTRVLAHIGKPTQAPVRSPARGPRAGEEDVDQTPVFDPRAAAPETALQFDQTVTWWRHD